MVVGQFGMGKSTLIVSIVKFMMMKVIASIIVMVTVMSLRIKIGRNILNCRFVSFCGQLVIGQIEIMQKKLGNRLNWIIGQIEIMHMRKTCTAYADEPI